MMTSWHVAFFIIKIFTTSLTGSIHLWDSEYFLFLYALSRFVFFLQYFCVYIYSLFHWVTCLQSSFKYILILQWHFLFTGIIGLCFWMDICMYNTWTIVPPLFYNLYFILHFYPFFFFFCLYISWIKQKY